MREGRGAENEGGRSKGGAYDKGDERGGPGTFTWRAGRELKRGTLEKRRSGQDSNHLYPNQKK